MKNITEKFLIDTNTIITPYRKYYPFDFATSFWIQLETNISNGSILILDMVKAEVEKSDDKLSDWIKRVSINNIVDRRDEKIIEKYAEILTYIQNSNFYSSKALIEWSQNYVADPWLIATSSVFDFTLITLESSAGNLSPKTPSGKPKIPDICKHFDVNHNDLFYMMRQLSFTLG